MMTIKYLKQAEIDKSKWDNCVGNAINCMIYGMSWYLDEVCENWDGLVLGNYQAVMPLPWKSKLGIKYIYHPFFAQQLGVFFTKDNSAITNDFLAAIPLKFLKYELSLNSMNTCHDIPLRPQINYVLSLHKTYDELLASYDRKCRRDVKISKSDPHILHTDISVDDFLSFKQRNMLNKLSHTHFERIKALLNYLIKNKMAKIVALNDSENMLLGAAAFVSYRSRIFYLFSASSDVGKKKRVMYRILDSVIEANANKNVYLDFEGSMIEGVAQFFKGFGPVSETYNRVQKSRIPFIK